MPVGARAEEVPNEHRRRIRRAPSSAYVRVPGHGQRELKRGWVVPADREHLRVRLARSARRTGPAGLEAGKCHRGKVPAWPTRRARCLGHSPSTPAGPPRCRAYPVPGRSHTARFQGSRAELSGQAQLLGRGQHVPLALPGELAAEVGWMNMTVPCLAGSGGGSSRPRDTGCTARPPPGQRLDCPSSRRGRCEAERPTGQWSCEAAS